MTIQNKKITAKRFIDEFKAQWEVIYTPNQQPINSAYNNDNAWTQFMLKNGANIIEKSFLEKVASNVFPSKRSKLVYEWYTVDALIVDGEDLYKSNLAYPSEIHAIIEHENQWDIETEMWKLIHWRAPLKVLIFYREELANMIFTTKESEMLKTLPQMLQSVQAFWQEPLETEYLFINGYKDAANTIQWQYCIFNPGKIPLRFDPLRLTNQSM